MYMSYGHADIYSPTSNSSSGQGKATMPENLGDVLNDSALVGGDLTILKNDGVKVSWDDSPN